MTSPDVDQPLVLRRSVRRQLPTFAAIAAFLLAYVLAGAFGIIHAWLVWTGVIVFGGVLLLGLYGALTASRSPREALRLDRSGVTVPGHPTVPWSDLVEVRVTGMQPRWLFPISLGYRVVASVGRPGAALPAIDPTPRLDRLRSVVPTRLKLYGTPLLVMPYAYDTTATTIVEAVRRLGGPPVRDGSPASADRRHRQRPRQRGRRKTREVQRDGRLGCRRTVDAGFIESEPGQMKSPYCRFGLP